MSEFSEETVPEEAEDEIADTEKGVIISANLLDDIYSDCPSNKSSHIEDENKLRGPKFNPPVYMQRYQKVLELAAKYKPRKIVDFGCAECKLLQKLKNFDFVEEIVGVDIDKELIANDDYHRRLRPLVADFLHCREKPLKISLFEGSIAETDDRFLDCDLVSCVEIIEHLDPPILDAVPQTVFGNMSPHVVVVTTPNSEFNILFPDFSGFRHFDHRFEWTRAEFQAWANDIATKFGYSVSFGGIGEGPEGTEHLGCCSQMALFEKNSQEGKCLPQKHFGEPYNLVKEIIFPYDENPLSLKEKIDLEVSHLVRFFTSGDEELQLTGQTQVPLENIFRSPRICRICDSLDTLRSFLEESEEVTLNEDKTAIVYSQPVWEDSDENDWGVADSEGERLPWTVQAYGTVDPEESWE